MAERIDAASIAGFRGSWEVSRGRKLLSSDVPDTISQIVMLSSMRTGLITVELSRIVNVGVQSMVFNSLYFCIGSSYNLYGAMIT